MRVTQTITKVVMVLLLAGAMFSAVAQTAAAKPATVGPKEAYCTSTGGLVEVRHAVYGTNGPPQDWLPLTAVEGFCQ